MFNFVHHLFIPRKSNNHRPKILHHSSLFIVVFLLLLSLFSFTTLKKEKPEVLGALTDVSSEELLQLTNIERQKAGQPPLKLNDQLSVAAHNKAQNMFAGNYWAHFGPDGTTPWKFIKEANYQYVYAGENLARGFTTTEDVVDAWMKSPTHRENILSSHYEEVGFAVVKGNLGGENTVLVVEMFGGKNPDQQTIANDGQNQQVIAVSDVTNLNQTSNLVQTKPLVDSVRTSYLIIYFILALLIITFVVDLLIVRKKNIARLAGHNIDHIIFLGAIFIFIALYINGVIL